MRTRLIIASLLFSGVVLAGESAPAPSIPFEQQAEFYRADSAVVRVQPTWAQVSADLEAARAAIQKTCGDKYTPSLDGKKMVCVAKPEPPVAPVTQK
jgi:hypothetical protein